MFAHIGKKQYLCIELRKKVKPQNQTIMNYKEFSEKDELAIIRNLVQFIFKRLSEHSFLIQVNIATLTEYRKGYETHEWITATRIVTQAEAWCAYNNILNGGLE